MNKLIVSSVFALVAIVAHAQPSMDPPKELDSFKWMAGKWSASTHWNMEGQEFDSKMDMDHDFDGQFFRSRSVTDMMGMKMTELILVGYDAKAKKINSYTFANWAPTSRLETVTFEGDKAVWAGAGWDGGDGKMTVNRSTMTKVSATEIKFVLEFKEGEKWAKVAEGTFKKQ